MVSEFTLLGLLLATVALAVPSPLVEAPIARGHEDRQSQPISHVPSRARSDATSINHMYNNAWAGAFVSRTIGGHIYLVDGAFTIPHVWLDQDQNTAEGQILCSLIIDGVQSMNFFQFGVAVRFTGRKARTQLSAFYTTQGHLYHFREGWLSMNVGDRIHVNLTLYSPTTALLYLLNESTMESNSKTIHTKGPLCGHDVGWLVVTPPVGRLADFGKVTFDGIRAVDVSGELYDLADATYKLDMEQDNHTLTHTTFDNSNTMSISYVQ